MMKRRGNLLHGTMRTATGLVFATALGASGSAHAIPKPKISAPVEAPARSAKPAKVDPAASAKFKQQADELVQQGRAEEAAALYGKAFESDPSNVAAAEEYGRSLFEKSKFREAADLFQKVASRNEPAAYWNLGHSLRKLHDYQGAADAYFNYVKLNPDDPDGIYSLAECYRKLGRNEDAATAYDLYLQRETRPEEQAWVEKAKKKLGDIKAAEAAKLQTQNTITTGSPMGGGMVIMLPGATPAPTDPYAGAAPTPIVTTPVVTTPDPTPVVVAPTPVVVTPTPETVPPAPIMTGLPRDPAAAVAKVKDGDRYFQQKQFGEALGAYQEAIKLDDQNTGALLKIGLVFANQNRFQDAIDTWEKVLQIDPSNKYAPTYIAKAKPRLETAATPIETTSQPVQATVPLSTPTVTVETPAPVAAPKVVTAEDEAAAKEAYRRAAQLMREQRFAESAAEASAALEKNPNYVNAYVARAGANYSLKNYPAAIADYFKALTINPDMATPLYGLARVYEKQGDTANACANYRKYAASNAADAQAQLKEQATRQSTALCGQ
jgi:tetratricopeptide (TPR) repeat protein